MRRGQTLQDKVVARIAQRQEDVFLPREFSDLGGEDHGRPARGAVRGAAR